MSEVEKFIIEAVGGPVPGRFAVYDGLTAILAAQSEERVSWPLPDTLPGPPGSLGFYEKVSQSELPSRPTNENVIRSASYEWRPTS